MKIDSKKFREFENEILIALTNHYYSEFGHTKENYLDSEKGGIYENKLAKIMGYELTTDDKPLPPFPAAAINLEANGYVRRMQRKASSPTLGIWPTTKGLIRAEYLELSCCGKVVYKIKEQWVRILIPIAISIFTTITTIIITLILSSIFGWFGLGK